MTNKQDDKSESLTKSRIAGVDPTGAATNPFSSLDKTLQKEIAQFFEDTEAHLQQLLDDFLSDAARKDQRLLWAVAFVLLFVSLGSVVVSGNEIKGPGDVKLTIEAPANLMKLGFFVCLFFEISYAIRCYLEWAAYSLKASLAEQQLHIVRIDTMRRVRPFSETREGLRAARADRWSALDSDPLSEEEIQHYNEQKIQHQRAMAVLEAKKEWMDKHLFKIRVSTLLRMAFEVLGPLLFGGYALFTSYRVLGW